jgi:hypothetical protein
MAKKCQNKFKSNMIISAEPLKRSINHGSYRHCFKRISKFSEKKNTLELFEHFFTSSFVLYLFFKAILSRKINKRSKTWIN